MALKNLDVVLAFAALMLILSLVVTTAVQAVVAALGLRGRNLFQGVKRLFQQLDGSFTPPVAEELSRKLLAHPAVARAFGRATQAISKEEFIKLANDLAYSDQVALSEDARAALQRYVQQVVVNIPQGQRAALAAAAEALPVDVALRINEAVANVSGSVQKVSVDVASWFDTVLDRTRDTFGLQTRLITAGAAVVLAFGLRVDSVYLVRQLSSNDEARARLVANAQPLLERTSQIMPGAAGQAAPADLDQNLAQLNALKQELRSTELEVFADSWGKTSFPGLAVTAVFLGLGAPFWYNALRQLSGLRPSIARLVDPKSGQAPGAS